MNCQKQLSNKEIYALSSISRDAENENNVLDFVTNFIAEFHIGRLLFKCNAGKEKGISVMSIFRYLFCLLFSDRSMYMQRKTGGFKENFSANIINDFMKPLTSDDRKDVFIIDDSLFDRSRSKKTELLAKVFDHCSMKYKRGYRILTLSWSDGNSFVPVNHCLFSAADNKNLLCEAECFDGRSLAGKRRR